MCLALDRWGEIEAIRAARAEADGEVRRLLATAPTPEPSFADGRAGEAPRERAAAVTPV